MVLRDSAGNAISTLPAANYPVIWGMLTSVAFVCGILYIFCWSALFYPQMYLNWKRKSVKGFSFELVLYNLVGFGGYSVYNIFRSHAQVVYDLPRAVKPHDVLFAVHGFVCSVILGAQIMFYDRGDQSIKSSAVITCGVIILIFGYLSSLALFEVIAWDAIIPDKSGVSSPDASITPIQFLGYIKAGITFVKYIPQIQMNIRRRSTQGIAIQVYVLDLGGATFSCLQNVLDALSKEDLGILMGNLPKLGISLGSSLYDCIILMQHFVIYRKSHYLRVPVDERVGRPPGMHWIGSRAPKGASSPMQAPEIELTALHKNSVARLSHQRKSEKSAASPGDSE